MRGREHVDVAWVAGSPWAGRCPWSSGLRWAATLTEGWTMLDLEKLDLEEIATALADQTDD